jgi:hypothetical protein
MLVIEDTDFDDAVQRLRSASFRDWPWSYGSRCPDFYKGPVREKIYRRIVHEYSKLDKNSTRCLFPAEQQETCKVNLLRSSYTHIRVESISDYILIRNKNIIYPDGSVLFKSFIQTLVREPISGMWSSNLDMWVITYIYGELMLSDDILDSCDDEKATNRFNENIGRGGLALIGDIQQAARKNWL